jgi:predicted RNA-binding Zn ribbon-like protein
LLRRCANHDTCVLMFLDTSRSHTRRWCSMELCGNRSKVAAHDARSRGRKSP